MTKHSVINIPSTAMLCKEENGVKWYVDHPDKVNTIHYMSFNGRVLCGGWVGPRWIFSALVSMSQEERLSYHSHDEYMGAIQSKLQDKE